MTRGSGLLVDVTVVPTVAPARSSVTDPDTPSGNPVMSTATVAVVLVVHPAFPPCPPLPPPLPPPHAPNPNANIAAPQARSLFLMFIDCPRV